MPDNQSLIGLFVTLCLIYLISAIEASNLPISETNELLKPTVHVQTYNIDTCFVLKMGLYYETLSNESIKFEDGKVNEKDSECGSLTKIPVMAIDFANGGSITFMVGFDDKNAPRITEISGRYPAKEGFDYFKSPLPFYFETRQAGHYYKCDAEQNVSMTDGGHLFLKGFAYEVLRTSTSLDFYQTPDVCALDSEESISAYMIVILLIGIVLALYGLKRIIGFILN